MPVALPGPESRWRCGACGNLTRFDVIRALRSREFVHVSLAGVQEVSEREVLVETIERVTCRWCAAVDSVVIEPRPDHPEQVDDAAGRAAAVPDGES